MKKGPITYLNETISTLKRCWIPLHIIAFATIIPSEFIIIVFHGLMTGPSADFTYATIFIATAFLTVFQFYITILFFAGFYYLLGRKAKLCDFRRAIAEGQKRFGPLLLGYLLFFFVFIGGTVLFVLPAIYFAVKLVFMPMVIVLENKSVAKAFSRSFDLVKGRWWKTAWRLWPIAASWVVLILIAIILPDLVYVRGFIVAIMVDLLFIWMLIYLYRMYLDAIKTYKK